MEQSIFAKGAKINLDSKVVNLPSIIRKNQKRGALAEILFQSYIVQSQIGHGKFANVYSARDKLTGDKFALKIIDYQRIKKTNDTSKAEKILQLINREQQLLKSVDSPFVLKFVKSFQNKNWKIFVLQYCNEGTLINYLQDRNWCLEENQAIGILKQICLGVYELYKKSIIHRDLKLQNIMKGYGIFKIIDLGFSKQIDDVYENQIHTMVGSGYTMAPEVANYQKYGVKADIYSIGVIFLKLIVRNLEYHQRTPYKFREEKHSLKNYKYQNLSEEIIDFLTKTLQKNQDERIGWSSLLQHPIFKDHKHITESNIKQIVDQNFELLKNEGKTLNLHVFLDEQQEQQAFESEITVYFKVKRNAKLQDAIVQLKKAEFVLLQIVNRLQNKNYKIINYSSKSHMKLMTLLTQRVFFNLKQVTRQLQTVYCQESVKDYAFKLFRQSKQKYQNYSFLYNQLKQTIFYKIKGIPNLFKSLFVKSTVEMIEQQIFNGQQNKNFTKQQQIQLTLNSIKNFIDIIYSKKIRKRLLAYSTILDLQATQQSFDSEVNKILAKADNR